MHPDRPSGSHLQQLQFDTIRGHGLRTQITGLLTLPVVTRSNLGQVSEVVSLHLQVEYFRLSVGGFGYQEVIEKAEDVIADVPQLILDLLSILLGHLLFLL